VNIFEIDGDDDPFLFQQGTKRIHILLCDASIDAQHHEILADNPRSILQVIEGSGRLSSTFPARETLDLFSYDSPPLGE
jgi:hypothetical protein